MRATPGSGRARGGSDHAEAEVAGAGGGEMSESWRVRTGVFPGERGPVPRGGVPGCWGGHGPVHPGLGSALAGLSGLRWPPSLWHKGVAGVGACEAGFERPGWGAGPSAPSG